MRDLAIKWLTIRYEDQLKKFPKMADIGERQYVRANLKQTLRNMKNFPPGGEYVACAWREAK